MKKLFLLFLIPLALLTSCNDDENVYVRSFAVVVEAPIASTLLQRDNGEYLFTSEFNTTNTGGRLLIDYVVLGTIQDTITQIGLYDWRWILTKDVVALTSENEEAIGDDPFMYIYDISISGDYMNVAFAFNYYTTKHYINMVQDGVVGLTEDENNVSLEFRQNAYGDNIGALIFSLASFDLSPYKEQAKEKGYSNVNFTINSLGYGGKEFTFNVKYNLDNTSTFVPISGSDLRSLDEDGIM